MTVFTRRGDSRRFSARASFGLTQCAVVASLVFAPVVASHAQAASPSAPLPLKHTPQPTTAAITSADLMTRLYIFADDSMMGREVGTPYHLKATAYIEREVRKLGLVPAGDSGTYFQNLPVYDHPLAASTSIMVGDKKFTPGPDFIPRDNSVFGGKVRSIDGAQVVFGGTLVPQGDTSTIVSREAAAGKVVVIAVPNGPNGKPVVSGYRQPLTGYYLGAAAVAVVALDGFTSDERKVLLEPTQSMAGEGGSDLMLPAFLYVSPAMAEAMTGAPIASLKRGADWRRMSSCAVRSPTIRRAHQGEMSWRFFRAAIRN